MKRSLVEKYRLGMITDHQLVVESLQILDPENPGSVLSSLPENILLRVLRFTNEFQSGRMISNYGESPAQDQVFAAKDWIEKLLQHTANKTA